jgi:hypothetical protein
MLVRLRFSSPLFRMADPAHVVKQLFFHNTGPEQVCVESASLFELHG